MIGSVVGNYKIIEKIGEGGMGAVFKGVDLMLEREVAIKMLRPELARQPNIVERFRTEAVTLAKLNHSNVATLHSFFRQGDDFFMVMEFVRGKTLEEMIRTQGAMQCDRAIEMFCMALEGMEHAHKMGIVHRDIKPANMMLTETGSIKVMDFGIARMLGTDRLTKAGHLIGTVEYMSPEQVRGEETDARSDIYSLGILLYEMLTGRVPFNSTSEYELMRCQIEDAPMPPRSHAPHIPLPVEQAIMRSLAKKRESRYQSASEFRIMLMQRNNAAAVTRPFSDTGSRAGVYGSASTQNQTTRMTPPSGDVLTPTRLAGGQNIAPVPISEEIKATRLGQPAAALAYSQGAPASAQVAAAQSATGQASFLSKLNWKHYAGAGAAFFVIMVAVIAGAFALIGGTGKTDAIQPQTPPPAAQSPAPAVQSEPAPAQSAQPLPPPPAPVVSGNQQPAVSNSNSSGALPGRVRIPAPKTAETPSVSQQTPPVVQPPPQTQPAPAPPKEEKVVVASKPEPEKKEPEKVEKKKGIFGKLKDAITGGDKKKEEKKKP
jgi:serine/threonine protein kinase